MQNEIPNPQSNYNSISIICVNQAFSQSLEKMVKWTIQLHTGGGASCEYVHTTKYIVKFINYSFKFEHLINPHPPLTITGRRVFGVIVSRFFFWTHVYNMKVLWIQCPPSVRLWRKVLRIGSLEKSDRAWFFGKILIFPKIGKKGPKMAFLDFYAKLCH